MRRSQVGKKKKDTSFSGRKEKKQNRKSNFFTWWSCVVIILGKTDLEENLDWLHVGDSLEGSPCLLGEAALLMCTLRAGLLRTLTQLCSLCCFILKHKTASLSIICNASIIFLIIFLLKMYLSSNNIDITHPYVICNIDSEGMSGRGFPIRGKEMTTPMVGMMRWYIQRPLCSVCQDCFS